jgi:outer membrane receptor protein involved in Fe transport
MKYLIFLFLFPLVIYSAVAGSARENLDTLKTYHLKDSIIVIASRYQLSFGKVTNSVDMIVEKKTNELANHSVLQLVDMLSPNSFVLEKKVIGFGVGSNGSGNVSLRGLGGRPNTGILVLINGRPDFMGIFGHPLPDVYGLEGIQQIEVIKGPSSSLFGSNAMGGVINLVTSSASTNSIKLNVGGGSYNTFFQHAQLSRNQQKLKLNGFFSHQKTDGHLDSSKFESWNMNAKMEYRLSNHWKTSIEGRYVPFKFDDPFMGADIAQLGYYGKIRRGMVDAGIEGESGHLKNSFHLYSNLGHHRFSDGFESHDFTYGLSSYQNYDYSSKLVMSFGLDALHYGGKAWNTVLPQAPPQPDLHTINTLGIYYIAFYSPNVYLSLQGGGRFHYSSLAENIITPSLGISLLPVSKLKLFGNYNQGFRLPTLQELYLFPPSNPNLKFEEVAGYEAGILYQFYGQNFLKGSYFHNQVKNLIQQVANPTPPPGQIFINGESAKQNGVEIMLQLTTDTHWAAQFSYSYLDPDILTAFNPESMVKYYLSYHASSIRLTLFGKSVSKWYADNYSRSPLKGYQLFNLSGTLSYKGISLDIQLRNLLDRRYQVLPDYEAPRFHFLTSITFNWIYSSAGN